MKIMSIARRAGVLGCLWVLGASAAADATTEKVLYSFGVGNDGGYPRLA
jgi:hypothetical protein